ncbi:MAG: hypothetical protein HY880_08095 [Deltaproteobacteria bacterium]|nr:hypothetical protein [Deltaproteobacteria bacterium]
MNEDKTLKNNSQTATIKIIFLGAVLVSVLLDLLIPEHEPHFLWDRIPGFSALFGFSSTIVIILAAKALGRYLQRGEDYYE